MTTGNPTFDSVTRYKGQEAAAVVLVDVDPRTERLTPDLRVLFSGMTRATVRLDLAARRDNLERRRLFAELDTGGGER